MSKITERLDVAYRIRFSSTASRTPEDDFVYGSTTVLLTEGYSTRDDIPTMIALKRGVPVHAVKILGVTPALNQ